MNPLPCRSLFTAFALLALIACAKPQDFRPVPKVAPQQVYALAEMQVLSGPRPSGSENARKTAEWIRDTANRAGTLVTAFEADTTDGRMTFRNVVVTVPGKSDDRFVIVGAHYDTKRFASFPDFTGANDGASGVAALLAMIRVLPQRTALPFAIRFVFFDGEECLAEYSDTDGLHGSRAYADELARSGEAKNCTAMILLDMIGDTDLNVRFPADTEPGLLRSAAAVADRLNVRKQFSPGGHVMLDDHVPFQKLGIPAIDLIDFDYGPGNAYWHTPQDSLEHISGESIAAAANFTLELIWELAMEQ